MGLAALWHVGSYFSDQRLNPRPYHQGSPVTEDFEKLLKSNKYSSIPEHGDEAPERDKVPLGLVHGSRVWLLTLF